MFVNVTEGVEEGNLISLCPEEDCYVPDMPFFAASNLEDRPMAPAAEDYPLGCEVELRDVEFAKMAQESRYWEPIMETVFAVPRRRVLVNRHSGDYTFVLCSDIEGFERVGCTLYRACLSEPKVKATRYYSSIRSALSRLRLEADTDDILNKPLQQVTATAGAEISSGGCGGGEEVSASGSASNANNSAVAPARLMGTPGGAASTTEDSRRRSFMAYMKKGTAEISKRNCDTALRYYNRALEEMPEEEARVRSSRSVAYLLAGEKERALEDANRVVHLKPRESVGYIRTGNVLRSMKKFVDAQKMYATALKFDSASPVVRNLLDGNSVAMLYEGRTKRYNKIRIAYDDTVKRAMAVAAQNIDTNEVVRETSSCVFPLSVDLFGFVSGGRKCELCCHCGRTFVDDKKVTAQIPSLTKSLLHSIHALLSPVPCDSHCGALYCSEGCKSKAWVEHHWVECAQRGRWREGVPVVHRLLDQYVMCTPILTGAEEKTREAPVTPQCVAEDRRPIVTAACVRIAVRMMSRMVSSVLPALEAVQQYRWLPVTDVVHTQRQEVRELLRACYTTLSRSFSSQDSDLLTYDVFQDYYEKAKSNALMICCSTWPKVVERISSHAELVTAEDRPVGMHETETTFQSCLQQVMSAPRHGIPGTYHICISLFELASLMTPNNCTRAEVARPNVAVRTLAESAANLRFRILRPIPKREVLTMAWPLYDVA